MRSSFSIPFVIFTLFNIANVILLKDLVCGTCQVPSSILVQALYICIFIVSCVAFLLWRCNSCIFVKPQTKWPILMLLITTVHLVAMGFIWANRAVSIMDISILVGSTSFSLLLLYKVYLEQVKYWDQTVTIKQLTKLYTHAFMTRKDAIQEAVRLICLITNFNDISPISIID